MIGKKILLIGSTQYLHSMEIYAGQMTAKGHEVRLPFFDKDATSPLMIMEGNRELIEWADEIHLFWSQRTLGTLLDVGMAFALRKPIKVVYYEKMTIMDFLLEYEKNHNKS
jgi:hypothetical protein